MSILNIVVINNMYLSKYENSNTSIILMNHMKIHAYRSSNYLKTIKDVSRRFAQPPHTQFITISVIVIFFRRINYYITIKYFKKDTSLNYT